MSTPRLLVQRLHPYAIVPARQTAGASGLDLHVYAPLGHVDIPPTVARIMDLGRGVRSPVKLIPTGVAVEIPRGYEGQVRPRSSARKRGIDVTLGTIDSDYRGEINIQVANLSGEWLRLEHGQRIAQLVICPVALCDVIEVGELSETERGDGGFGSTGEGA